MLEPTKTPPTERFLIVACPVESYAEIVDILKTRGCRCEESKSAKEVFPERNPGNNLRGLRYREDLTQKQFAEKIGIPARHVSEMENGKRPIGKLNAQRIGDAFNIDPRLFL